VIRPSGDGGALFPRLFITRKGVNLLLDTPVALTKGAEAHRDTGGEREPPADGRASAMEQRAQGASRSLSAKLEAILNELVLQGGRVSLNATHLYVKENWDQETKRNGHQQSKKQYLVRQKVTCRI